MGIISRIIKGGKKVASSKGLEVVMRYHRTTSSIKNITGSGYYLYVVYSNGARLKTKFADKSVLSDWVNKKRRYLGFKFDRNKIRTIKWKGK